MFDVGFTARCSHARWFIFASVLLLAALVFLTRATSTVNVAPLLVFTVTNVNDSGPGSLRQALQDSNNTGGTDTITFNIPGAGVQTITLSSGLPGQNQPVIIDGTTQPGFAGTPLIEINGNGVGGDGPMGGGYNSTLSAGVVTLATPLAAADSVNVRFLFGVENTGKFLVFVFVEALP
ncbi:MAG: hypothetical protein ND866_29665 [Pyrinomonadaceae bacterium]|nr:hypothetical protein [Pyrinomonadaceae bacterium]